MRNDDVFEHVFGLQEVLSSENSESAYAVIEAKLATDDFRPRALFDQFNIEALATTDGALDDLSWHAKISDSGWNGRVITTYRPDSVVDPEFPNFVSNAFRAPEYSNAFRPRLSGERSSSLIS